MSYVFFNNFLLIKDEASINELRKIARNILFPFNDTKNEC